MGGYCAANPALVILLQGVADLVPVRGEGRIAAVLQLRHDGTDRGN